MLEDRRLLAIGDLDVTFGQAGVVNIAGPGASDMVLQPDGKIVAVGTIFDLVSGEADPWIARYNSDGTLDSSFDGDGTIVLAAAGRETAAAVDLQSDGKIVVAGDADDPVNDSFRLLRLNPDGSLDGSFGSSGRVTTNIGPGDNDESLYDLLIQSDGKIVALGDSRSGGLGIPPRLAMVRYNVNGSIDTSFGTGGIVTTNDPNFGNAYATAELQTDGKIVVTGFELLGAANDMIVRRYNVNGSIDSTFGSGGTATIDFGTSTAKAHDLAIQADGKIVLAGTYFGGDGEVALARLQTNGTLDPSFGSLGKVLTDVNGSDSALSIAVRPDGKLVVGGSSDVGGLLIRYNTNGILDASFGVSGVKNAGPTLDNFHHVVTQPDGRFVASAIGNSVPKLARFFADPQTIVKLEGPNTVPPFGLDLVIQDWRYGGKDDKLKLSFVDGKIRIEDLNGIFITALVGTGDGTPVVEVDPALVTGNAGDFGDIRVYTTAPWVVPDTNRDDRLIIDSSLAEWGKTIGVDRGTPVLRVVDPGGTRSIVLRQFSQVAEMVVDGSLTIRTPGPPIDVTGFNNVTVVVRNEIVQYVLSLHAAMDAIDGTAPTMRLTHPYLVGGYRLFNNQNVVIDATAPSIRPSSIQVWSALSSAIGNRNLTLRASLSSNPVDQSPVVFDSSVSVPGTLTVDAPKVDLNAPVFAGTLIGNATTIKVGGTGLIQQAIILAAATATINVTRGTYPGDVNTSGKSIVLASAPSIYVGRISIIGSLLLDANDRLVLPINGGNPGIGFTLAGKYGNLAVLGRVSLGGATLSLSGTHAPVENLTLISNDQLLPVTGAYAPPYLNGADVLVNGVPMTLRYDGGDGNDVVLVDLYRPTVELVSVASETSDSAGGLASPQADVSADGRYVAFVSTSPNIVAGVTLVPGIANVYRLDRQTGQIVLVSASNDGLSGGNQSSFNPHISDDGNTIAFDSQASNLHPLKTSLTHTEAFVRRIAAGQTLLASVNAGGSGSGNGGSFVTAISANGQVVVYESRATNLHPLDTTAFVDVYAFNVGTGANKLVSVNKTNDGSGNNRSHGGVISADGNVIAYYSYATDLHPLDTNPAFYQDVFTRNLTTNTTTMVSINQAGTSSVAGGSFDPVISADGSIVAFRSNAVGLEPIKTTSSALDVFARNLSTGITELVSVDKANNGGGDANSYKPVINADGSVVAFASDASNLHPADNNGRGVIDVFARNLIGNTTALVSRNQAGEAVGASSTAMVISASGNLVAFSSNATNVHPLDTTATTDIFVRNLSVGTLALVSHNQTGDAAGNSSSTTLAISADGSVVAFGSFATDLTPLVDENGFEDLFIYSVGTGDLTLGSKRAASLPSKSAGGTSFPPAAVSADGRYVAFHSYATNLVAGIKRQGDAYSPVYNVYRYDRLTGDMLLVSVSSDGLSYGDFDSGSPVISADGSVVAFTSSATNLQALDNHRTQDIFARNLNTNITYLVSISSSGNNSGDNDSFAPTISANGNVVAFGSYASNLHALDSNGTEADVFARNLATNTTHLVSVNTAGNGSGNDKSGDSESGREIAINADGSVVVFSSYATNLHSLDADPVRDVFARHLIDGITTLVSINKDGNGGGNVASFQPTISADGNVVAFQSNASNLHSLDANSTGDIFARNLAAGVTSLVSVNSLGTAAGNSDSSNPILSADGTVVAFGSIATDLHALDNNAQSIDDVFARNLVTNTTHLVSLGSGEAGNAASTATSISANGKVVVFESVANNLHSADAGANTDVFVRNIERNTTRLVSLNQAGTEGGNERSFTPTVSADGRVIVFGSHATNLVAGDFNQWPDIFAAAIPASPQNIISLPKPGGGGSIHLQSPSETQLAASLASDPGVAVPAGIEFPFGFLDFVISGLAPGAAATLVISGVDTALIDAYYKYGATPANASQHWYNFLFGRPTDSDSAVGTGMEIVGGNVVLHLIDGARGDDDRAANGVIKDIGGPAIEDGKLEAVTNVTATAAAANKIRLAWTDSFTGETGFKIERSDAGAPGNFVQVATVAANATNYDDVNLQSSLNYTYRVRAFNAAGDGAASTTASAVTPQLVTITGTPGHDTYHVVRSGTLLRVYENIAPVGQPTYSSELAAMTGSLSINAAEGNDALTVDTGGQTALGLNQLNYNAGAGGNTLILKGGSARIDSTATGGTLDSTVEAGAQLATRLLRQQGLSIGENGRVTLLPDGETSVITSLTLGTGATLDIGNNAVVLDYSGASPEATIRERILSGRGRPGLGEGTWTGAGITSSAAAAANQIEPESRSVGYAENALLPLGAYTTFRGVPVDATAVLIAYTRSGDANLDGVVGDDDVTVLGASHAPGVPNAAWALGDFDYDGFVDDDDVTVVGVFYNPAAFPLASTELLGGDLPRSISGNLEGMPSIAEVAAAGTASNVAADPGSEILTYFDAPERPNLDALRLADLRASQLPVDDDELIELLANSIVNQREITSVSLASSARSVGRTSQAAYNLWAQW